MTDDKKPPKHITHEHVEITPGRIKVVPGPAPVRQDERERKILALVAALTALSKDRPDHDAEPDHIRADELLVAFIDDPRVRAAFERVDKWYA